MTEHGNHVLFFQLSQSVSEFLLIYSLGFLRSLLIVNM
jgi:hypothetical protein